MKDPVGISPSKGNQGTTQGKEKIILTSVGIELTTSGLDLPLILCSTICVLSATRYSCACTFSYKCTAHVWFAHVFKHSFSGIRVALVWV